MAVALAPRECSPPLRKESLAHPSGLGPSESGRDGEGRAPYQGWEAVAEHRFWGGTRAERETTVLRLGVQGQRSVSWSCSRSAFVLQGNPGLRVQPRGSLLPLAAERSLPTAPSWETRPSSAPAFVSVDINIHDPLGQSAPEQLRAHQSAYGMQIRLVDGAASPKALKALTPAGGGTLSRRDLVSREVRLHG